MAIDWANMKVTKEQADATLRDSVNKFYEHQKNDSSVSPEEAQSSTAQMAEGYLSYMSNFSEGETAEGGQSNSNSVGLESSGAEGGMSGGADGGMSGGADGGASGGMSGGM